jgi:hypothetical protein
LTGNDPVEEILLVDPGTVESMYVDSLNRSFGHWGDVNLYRWCFERSVGGLTPHMMLIRSNGEVKAGSAVTYRKVRHRQSIIRVGIMTGSWTLPDARGKGYFTKITEQSLRGAKSNKAALLLAFVTETNPSFRRLVQAGASLFPTHYLVSSDTPSLPAAGQEPRVAHDIGESVDIMLGRLATGRRGHTRFEYTPAEWQSQFLDRPGEIEVLMIEDGNIAIVEKQGLFDRILFLSLKSERSFSHSVALLLRRALLGGRKVFLFTTSLQRKRACEKLGFQHIPGCLTALKADTDKLARAYPEACLGEFDLSQGATDSGHPWPFGRWDVNTGDRM